MAGLNNFWNAVEKLAGRRIKTSDFDHDGARPEGIVDGGFEGLFWNNKGPVVHKWIHYLPIYERHLAQYRGSSVRFLEIGVSKGGSLQMWREYFGPDATIFGVDIDPTCSKFDGIAGQVRIGSQDDASFLASVVDEMGGVDVILDDGSHDSRHIRASLAALYPRLENGGLYMIEDLNCAYWPLWSGGYRRRISFMTDIKQMIDDMHHWYHGRGQGIAATADALSAMHIYDSIVVLEKRLVERPSHIEVGSL